MNGVWDLITRAGPIMLGGGAIQLIIYFLKRRGDNRKLHADTDSTVVTSASASVAIASKLRDEAMERVVVLESRCRVMEEQVTQLAGLVASERANIAQSLIREAVLNHEIAILKSRADRTPEGT